MGNFLLASSQYGTRFYRDRYNTPETDEGEAKFCGTMGAV